MSEKQASFATQSILSPVSQVLANVAEESGMELLNHDSRNDPKFALHNAYIRALGRKVAAAIKADRPSVVVEAYKPPEDHLAQLRRLTAEWRDAAGDCCMFDSGEFPDHRKILMYNVPKLQATEDFEDDLNDSPEWFRNLFGTYMLLIYCNCHCLYLTYVLSTAVCGLLGMATSATAHRGVSFTTLQKLWGQLRNAELLPSKWAEVQEVLNDLNLKAMNGNVPTGRVVKTRCKLH